MLFWQKSNTGITLGINKTIIKAEFTQYLAKNLMVNATTWNTPPLQFSYANIWIILLRYWYHCLPLDSLIVMAQIGFVPLIKCILQLENKRSRLRLVIFGWCGHWVLAEYFRHYFLAVLELELADNTSLLGDVSSEWWVFTYLQKNFLVPLNSRLGVKFRLPKYFLCLSCILLLKGQVSGRSIDCSLAWASCGGIWKFTVILHGSWKLYHRPMACQAEHTRENLDVLS